jgi:hypothetical protein
MNIHNTETTDLVLNLPVLPAPGEVAAGINKAFAEIYDKIKAEIAELSDDVSTEKNRAAIRSVAHKIARTKTGLDAAAKALVDEPNKIIAAVNRERMEMREYLDALKEQVRRPVTKWEEQEEIRQERVEDTLRLIRNLPVLPMDCSEATARLRLQDLLANEPDPKIFLDGYDNAMALFRIGVSSLEDAILRIRKADEERAELERLRAAEAERERKEAEAKAEAERAQRELDELERRAAREAAIAEEARLAAEREAAAKIAEAERKVREAEEAARKAADAAREQERARQEKIEADKRLADEIEARAAERRAANQKHRIAVRAAAVTALCKHSSIDEATAKTIIAAIETGAIPAVTITF